MSIKFMNFPQIPDFSWVLWDVLKILLGWTHIKWKIHTRNRSRLVCCDLLFILHLWENKSLILSEFPGTPPWSYCSNYRLVHDWVQFLSRIPDYFTWWCLNALFWYKAISQIQEMGDLKKFKKNPKVAPKCKQKTLASFISSSLDLSCRSSSFACDAWALEETFTEARPQII